MTLTNVTCKINDCHHSCDTLFDAFFPLKTVKLKYNSMHLSGKKKKKKLKNKCQQSFKVQFNRCEILGLMPKREYLFSCLRETAKVDTFL